MGCLCVSLRPSFTLRLESISMNSPLASVFFLRQILKALIRMASSDRSVWKKTRLAQVFRRARRRSPDRARRRSPDLAETADRRSPAVANEVTMGGDLRSDAGAGSGDPRTAGRARRRSPDRARRRSPDRARRRSPDLAETADRRSPAVASEATMGGDLRSDSGAGSGDPRTAGRTPAQVSRPRRTFFSNRSPH